MLRTGAKSRQRRKMAGAVEDVGCLPEPADVPMVAIEREGTYLIVEITKDGTRRRIGRYMPVDFADAPPELKARRKKRAPRFVG
jgi:hypothetical protein